MQIHDNTPATCSLNFVVGREALAECSSPLLQMQILAGAMQLGWKPAVEQNEQGIFWHWDVVETSFQPDIYERLTDIRPEKSQQHQGPSLIASLLCCLFSREISLKKEQEKLQYLSCLGQGFEKFKISLASENSLF